MKHIINKKIVMMAFLEPWKASILCHLRHMGASFALQYGAMGTAVLQDSPFTPAGRIPTARIRLDAGPSSSAHFAFAGAGEGSPIDQRWVLVPD